MPDEDAPDGFRASRKIGLLTAKTVEEIEKVAGQTDIDRLAIHLGATFSWFFGAIKC